MSIPLSLRSCLLHSYLLVNYPLICAPCTVKGSEVLQKSAYLKMQLIHADSDKLQLEYILKRTGVGTTACFCLLKHSPMTRIQWTQPGITVKIIRSRFLNFLKICHATSHMLGRQGNGKSTRLGVDIRLLRSWQLKQQGAYSSYKLFC